MKKISFIFSVLICSVCFAQNDVQLQATKVKNTLKIKRFVISANIGISSPYEGFGAKDTINFFMSPKDSDKVRGFANIGFHSQVDAGYFITKHIGITGKVVFDYHKLDVQRFNDFLAPQNFSPVISFDGGYSVWQYMGGPFISFDTKDNTTICLKAMFGIINMNYPDIYFLTYSGGLQGKFADASNLAYSFTSDFEKRLSSLIGIKATFGYTAATIKYPSLSSIYKTSPSANYTTNYPIIMSYGSLLFSGGLNFYF